MTGASFVSRPEYGIHIAQIDTSEYPNIRMITMGHNSGGGYGYFTTKVPKDKFSHTVCRETYNGRPLDLILVEEMCATMPVGHKENFTKDMEELKEVISRDDKSFFEFPTFDFTPSQAYTDKQKQKADMKAHWKAVAARRKKNK